MNLLVDFVRSTEKSRQHLNVGGILGPDRPQKRYNKLDGVAIFSFYKGLKFSGRFYGRFGAKMGWECRSRRDLYLGRANEKKTYINKY